MFPFSGRCSFKFQSDESLEISRERYFQELEKLAIEEKSPYYPTLSLKHLELSLRDNAMDFLNYSQRGMVLSQGTIEYAKDEKCALVSFNFVMPNIFWIFYVIFAPLFFIFVFKLGIFGSILAVLAVLGINLLIVGIYYVRERDRISHLINKAWKNSFT